MKAVIIYNKHQLKDIYEIDYSFNYCYQANRRAIAIAKWIHFDWIDIASNQDLAEVRNPSKVAADYFIVINDPELLFSIDIIEEMLRIAADKSLSIVAPVYNESTHSNQIASLTIPYLNYICYLEIANKYFIDNSPTDTSLKLPLKQVDNSLVCFSREEFNKIPVDYTVEQIFSMHQFKATILNNILIHRFGNYYESYRDDLLQLIPEEAKTVLDIGCARGFFGKHIKQQRPNIYLTGVEMNPIMAKEAAQYYDRILNEKVETITIDEKFDHINCGDLLEHLETPWLTVEYLYKLLKTGGTFVASVPNVGHWSIIKDLSEGRFEYLPIGLTCISHIRWFTEISLRFMFQNAGFKIKKIFKQQLPPTPEGEAFIQHLASFSESINIDSLRSNELTILAIK